MIPKEKAKELFKKFEFIYTYDGLGIQDNELTRDNRKQCALIAVDEIQELLLTDEIYNPNNISFERVDEYWQEVKNEIEKL